MDLQQIVSGIGTLHSRTSRNVSTSLSYKVSEIFVNEGDWVVKDQILAKLDTADIDKKINDISKDIAEAEKNDRIALSQAERKLGEAINTRDINLSKNETAVAEAKNKLEAAVNDTLTAESILANAMFDLQNALYLVISNTNNISGIYTAQDLEYFYRQSGLLEDEYFESTYTLESAKQYLALYFSLYSEAVRNYESFISLQQTAKTTLEKAVETKDSSYRSDSISIENAKDAVVNQKNKDSASNYRTQLEGYLEEKEKCSITAPISGTVTVMNAELGLSATASGNTSNILFVIEDTKNLEITSIVPEYDGINIVSGMKVSITSDAFNHEDFEGIVKSVSTKADDNNNFTVIVQVTSPTEHLVIGMSAKFNIILESKTNVFAVPYDAITKNADGENVVYMYSMIGDSTNNSSFIIKERLDSSSSGSNPHDGTARPTESISSDHILSNFDDITPVSIAIKVETGMETDYYVEIMGEGLVEGMILLADPEGRNTTSASGANASMGGFALGGRM